MNRYVLACILLCSINAFGQKFKVQKIKGDQAVIEVLGGTLQPGRIYEANSPELLNNISSSAARDYVFALSFNLLNTKSDATGAQNETDISLTGKFGWNFSNFELGPMMSYSSNDSGDLTTTIFKLGAFADYNIIANIPGEIFIYGLGGTAAFGQFDNGITAKQDLLDAFVGPFVKWFPSGSNMGIRFDTGYIYQKQSIANTEVTVTGLSANIDLLAYF